jgi:signal transduction histidine kinase
MLHQSDLLAHFPEVLPWLAIVALADLMPVPIWGSVELMMSFPVLLASAFVFPPYVVGALAFLGSLDTREIRREIPLGRALFNRSNLALSVIVASWIFHSLGADVLDWPHVVFPASAALCVDFLVNATLVILGTRLLTKVPASRLIRNVYGGDQPAAFLGGYLCFGLMALVLATVYEAAGAWGLIAFAIPVLLARQMFVHWKALALARVQLEDERRILAHVSSRIADERRDERLTVAAGIHDDVLPPLYKVHLMGQVLRQDFASGRLLDLEADIPDLLQATEAASLAFRDLIRDLRRSTLGPGGLVHTLRLLVTSLTNDSGIRIELEAEAVPGTPLTHLRLYQVAREALANVVRHSQAERARVTLHDAGDAIRLAIEDDGCGFQPSLVDRDHHFGLQLMRERVELAGGTLEVVASSDGGTRVDVTVPVDRLGA